MSKKLLALLTALIFVCSLFINVYGEETNGKTVNFNITSDNKNSIVAKHGDEIIINYTIENADEDSDFLVTIAQNTIVYDKDFFEFKGIVEFDDRNMEAGLHTTSLGDPRIYFNGSHFNQKTYESKQFMGSFKLKVKAKEGRSEISSINFELSDENGVRYNAHSKALLVNIGDQPETLYTITYKNGDVEVGSSSSPTGKIKIGQSAPLAPNGCKFVGWKNVDDEKIYQIGDDFDLIGDTTFIAVWEEIKETKNYTLTFETNGGNKINSLTQAENTVIDLSKYAPKKSGYTFKGWYSESGFTNKITSITLDGDKTVYAKWEKTSGGNGGNNSGNSGGVGDGIPTTPTVPTSPTAPDNTNNANNGAGYRPESFTTEHIAYIIGRDSGYVYPNDILTRAEAAEMIYRLIKPEIRNEVTSKDNRFKDVNPEDWYNTSVSSLVKLGVIKGKTADTFAPDDSITRAEFTVIMVRFSDVSYDGENIFDDIAEHWAKDYINTAASIGWIVGDNGFFRPDDSITRAEVITLINRVLNRQPETKSDLLDGMITPPDNIDENTWYYLAIQEAVNGHDYEIKVDNIHERWTNLNQ